MKVEIRVLFKLFAIFFILSAIFISLTAIFGFPHFLFKPEVSNVIRKTAPFATLVINGLSAYLGFTLAKNRNRDQRRWATLCFIFSFWGLIYLYLLPAVTSIEKSGKSELG
jgi:hypothetical protein